ncbi:hypothetical protein D9M71_523880 [compost metagenome]
MLAVLLDAHGVVAGAQLDARHIGRGHDLALFPHLEHDLLEFVFGFQAAANADGNQEVRGCRRGFRTQLAGGCLGVLFADRVHHVGYGEPAGGQLVRVQPDAHGVVARPVEPDVADALDSGQLVLDVEGQVVAQVQGVVLRVFGEEAHIHQRRG